MTTKTTNFNLIILDESGSMGSLVKQTIDGCNEALNVVRSIQRENPDTQRCLVSIYAFQSGAAIPSRYLCKNVPVAQVNNVTARDYQPCGMTPLLDAVGSTLVDLRAVASTHEDAVGTVTIITDGYENDSREYTWHRVAQLITELKAQGWTFNFIGANIDVDQVSKKMNIDNAMAFEATPEGTHKMWVAYNDNMASYTRERIHEEANMCEEDRQAYRVKKSKSFFKK